VSRLNSEQSKVQFHSCFFIGRTVYVCFTQRVIFTESDHSFLQIGFSAWFHQ